MKDTTKDNKHTIDATGVSLGRLSSQIAALLLAKNSTAFVRNLVADVKVEVVNASKMTVTGDKMKSKVHKRYSGYPGGLKLPNWQDISAKKGFKELVYHAVEGMLPKNKLQKNRMKNLVVND